MKKLRYPSGKEIKIQTFKVKGKLYYWVPFVGAFSTKKAAERNWAKKRKQLKDIIG